MRLMPISNVLPTLVLQPPHTVLTEPPQMVDIKHITMTTVPPLLQSSLEASDPIMVYLAVGVTLFFMVLCILIVRCCNSRRKRIRAAYDVYAYGLNNEQGERIRSEPVYDAPQELLQLNDQVVPTPPPPPPPLSQRRSQPTYRDYNRTMSEEHQTIRESLESQLAAIYGNRSPNA